MIVVTNPAPGRASLSPLFTWRAAICDSDLRPVVRHVLFALSLYMSERGDSAFPGASRLAHDTGLAKRTVLGALGVAEAAGWLEVKRRGGSHRGGQRLATEYSANIPTGDRAAPVTDDHRYVSERSPVTLTTPTGDPPAPHVVKKATRKTPLLPVVAEATPARRTDELFNALAEALGIVPGELTPSARGAMNKALADLRKVGADADEIYERAAVYRRMYPNAALTPSALARHWPQLIEKNVRASSPVGRALELARKAGR